MLKKMLCGQYFSVFFAKIQLNIRDTVPLIEVGHLKCRLVVT